MTTKNSQAQPTPENVKYVGVINCQTSMCHGGASPSRYQFTQWNQKDAHSRAYATLTTARSARIAESLHTNATESTRCTTCHAPLALPNAHLWEGARVTEGVSCENCHNSAVFWLRGHTRPDWNYSDRVHAGMANLRSAYVRGTTCVACHQVLDGDILSAGHPELIFELDGQTASETRHWQEKENWFGPKAWLVGQAIALSKISQQLEKPVDAAHADLLAEEQALSWLLQLIPEFSSGAPKDLSPDLTEKWSNQIALTVSGRDWKPTTTREFLTALAGSSPNFQDTSLPAQSQCFRAERLVLGLDRLLKALHSDTKDEIKPEVQAELSALFEAVQDRTNFKPTDFASLLQKFASSGF